MANIARLRIEHMSVFWDIEARRWRALLNSRAIACRCCTGLVSETGGIAGSDKSSSSASTSTSGGTSNEPQTITGHITLGPGWTKILNGFFWDREAPTATPGYILGSDIEIIINGSPETEDNLMARPSTRVGGITYAYRGYQMLSFATLSAFIHLDVWTARGYVDYLSYELMETIFG